MTTTFDNASPLLAKNPSATSRRAKAAFSRLGIDSFLNRRRLEREELFERTHASFWEPSVLDRLSLPLSRYHE